MKVCETGTTVYRPHLRGLVLPFADVITKSELNKSVDLSLCGLAPARSQMDLFLDTLCARNKQMVANFNQSEEATSHVTASAMLFHGHDN